MVSIRCAVSRNLRVDWEDHRRRGRHIYCSSLPNFVERSNNKTGRATRCRREFSDIIIDVHSVGRANIRSTVLQGPLWMVCAQQSWWDDACEENMVGKVWQAEVSLKWDWRHYWSGARGGRDCIGRRPWRMRNRIRRGFCLGCVADVGASD